MATTVTVSELHGTRQIRLDAGQLRLFLAELSRVKSRYPFSRGVPYRIAPDILVTIRKNGVTTRYLLYDRVALLQESTKKKWQFYFGLLLHEWLYR
jgi:hypothetical protein